MKYCGYCGEIVNRKSATCPTCGHAYKSSARHTPEKSGGSSERDRLSPVYRPESVENSDYCPDLSHVRRDGDLHANAERRAPDFHQNEEEDTLPRPAMRPEPEVYLPRSQGKSANKKGLLILCVVVAVIAFLTYFTLEHVNSFSYHSSPGFEEGFFGSQEPEPLPLPLGDAYYAKINAELFSNMPLNRLENVLGYALPYESTDFDGVKGETVTYYQYSEETWGLLYGVDDTIIAFDLFSDDKRFKGGDSVETMPEALGITLKDGFELLRYEDSYCFLWASNRVGELWLYGVDLDDFSFESAHLKYSMPHFYTHSDRPSDEEYHEYQALTLTKIYDTDPALHAPADDGIWRIMKNEDEVFCMVFCTDDAQVEHGFSATYRLDTGALVGFTHNGEQLPLD